MLDQHLSGKQFAPYACSLSNVLKTEEAGWAQEEKRMVCFSPSNRMVQWHLYSASATLKSRQRLLLSNPLLPSHY